MHACTEMAAALTFSDSRLMPSSMSIKEDILVCSFCLLWIGVVEVCEGHTCLMPTSTSVWLSESGGGDLPMSVTVFPKG